MNRGPIIRLMCGLCTCGAYWDNRAFADLFERLGAIAGTAGAPVRYLGYHGLVGNRTEIRLFGIEVSSVGHVPDGMIALELDDNTITVHEPTSNGQTASWHDWLAWNWLDSRNGTSSIGEFASKVPRGWISREGDTAEFVLSANACFEKGKPVDDDVSLVDYDPRWPTEFSEIAEDLRNTVAPEILLRVEHYGSTAIPNMLAKPVIDILIEVPSFGAARRSLIPAFNRPECEYWWYDDHMMFVLRREPMGKRKCHIHIAPAGHSVWEGLAFRDYLRTHPDDANLYAELKVGLAQVHREDREAYTQNKEGFVRRITEKALVEL